MKKKVLAAVIIAAGLLVGCGKEEEPSLPVIQNMTPEPVATQAPEETQEPEEIEIDENSGLKMGGEDHPIVERIIQDGKMQSYLTGEWKDADVVQRRNMAVMIPNNNLKVPGTSDTNTVPQHGISAASIIY